MYSATFPQYKLKLQYTSPPVSEPESEATLTVTCCPAVVVSFAPSNSDTKVSWMDRTASAEPC